MPHPATYYDLLDAFRLDGCPVCRLCLAGTERYFDSLNFECINDASVRDRFRAAHGFCRQHAYQWLGQHGRVLATAIIYKDVYTDLREKLRELRYEEPGTFASLAAHLRSRLMGSRFSALTPWLDRLTGRRARVLVGEDPCPGCVVRAREEEKAIEALLDSIDEPGFEKAYSLSTGLCLPHLKRALAAAPHQAAFETLAEVELARQDLLLDQMDEIIRKEDPRYQDEPVGLERGAAGRAVRAATGSPWSRVETDRERLHEEWLPVARVSSRASSATGSNWRRPGRVS